MPLEDALVMLSKNFNDYLSKLRFGSEQPSLNFLLHLLSDGKQLSAPELDRIVNHLKERRDKLLGNATEELPPKGRRVITVSGDCLLARNVYPSLRGFSLVYFIFCFFFCCIFLIQLYFLSCLMQSCYKITFVS